jgi:hypothetical protein
MRRRVLALMAVGVLVAVGLVACDKGPMQRTGEKIDRATDQDKLIGAGPLEQTGKNIDKAVRGLGP